MTSLELRGVTICRDGTPLFAPLDLTVRPGWPLTIMGPSGAGKSSLLGWLTGMLPEGLTGRGEVLLDGRSIVNEPPNRREDVVADAVGSVDAVLGDEVPDLDEVDFRFWMKREFVHPRARRSPLLRCRRSSTSSPLIGFTCPLLISS